jgi:hypothetical protein
MTNLTDNIAVALLAERDGIHPAHAANRLALAIRVVEVVTAIHERTHTDMAWIIGRMISADGFFTAHRDFHFEVSHNLWPGQFGREVSNDTLRLALQIVEASR